jgi:FMN reductase
MPDTPGTTPESILILSASLDPASRSRQLARRAAETLGQLGVEHRFVDLRDHDLPLCDGDACYSHPAVGEMSRLIRDAAGIIVAVPIYNYDVNAAVKNLLELTGRAWNEKVVGFLCAAGGHGSYMSVMGFANSLMLDFRCHIVPRFVYGAKEAFMDDEDGTVRIVSDKVRDRTDELAGAVVRLSRALAAVGPIEV